jgi:hypothetical protein
MVDVLKRKSVSSRKNVQMLRFGEVDGCENMIITITAHVIVSLFSLSFSLSLTHLINILGISYNTLQDRADRHRCLLFSSCLLESGEWRSECFIPKVCLLVASYYTSSFINYLYQQ